jgi:hypothetical protein
MMGEGAWCRAALRGFPALLHATTLDLSQGAVSRTDDARRTNPPILHRKTTLLLPGDPWRPTFAALTRMAEEAGLFAEAHRIGTKSASLERVKPCPTQALKAWRAGYAAFQ